MKDVKVRVPILLSCTCTLTHKQQTEQNLRNTSPSELPVRSPETITADQSEKKKLPHSSKRMPKEK